VQQAVAYFRQRGAIVEEATLQAEQVLFSLPAELDAYIEAASA
jgi:hypothetical protein